MKYQPSIKDKQVDSLDKEKVYENTFEITDDYLIYQGLNYNYLKEYNQPVSIYPNLTNEDYENEYIDRYFIKKRNDYTSIIEIDDVQFGELGSTINDDLYIGIQISWKIYGKRNDVLQDGIISEYGIEDTNIRTLQLHSDFDGLTSILTNPLEFSRIKL